MLHRSPTKLWTLLLIGLFLAAPAAGSGRDGSLSATFLGGSSREGMFLCTTAATDGEGNVYLAGRSNSTDLPTTPGCYDPAANGRADVVVAKFSPDLDELLACTYLGGSLDDQLGRDQVLLVAANGDVILAVQTKSSDFPHTVGAYDPDPNGGFDVAVVRLSSDLTTLVAATFLGSPDYDLASSAALGPGGEIYLAGITRSGDFPTTPGCYDASYNGTGAESFGGDLFLARLSPDLTELEAATFLGGQDWEYGGHLVLGAGGRVYVTGGSRSEDLPVPPGAYQPAHVGPDSGLGADTFVACLDADLTTLEAATYLGGSLDDWGYGMTVAPDGAVYVMGHTSSQDFPRSVDAFQAEYRGNPGVDVGDEVFLTRLDANLTELQASTYLGGAGWDAPNGIQILSDGTVFLAGQCGSSDFPVTPGSFGPVHHGGSYGYGGEVFVSRLDGDLTELEAGTYIGGSGQDGLGSLVLAPDGRLVLSGVTNSEDFPATPGSYDPSYNQGSTGPENGDLYVLVIDPDLVGTVPPTPTPEPTPTPGEIWYDLTLEDALLEPGETFRLDRSCGNPLGMGLAVDEYVILEVQGRYWFWPGWTEELDLRQWTLEAGQTETETILELIWPEGAGSMSGLRFWGALLEAGSMEVVLYTWVEWGFQQ